MREFEVIRKATEYYGISLDSIYSKDCTRNVVNVRQKISFILYNFLDLETDEIAKILNMHKHSVYVYNKRVQEDFDYDKNLRKLLVSFI